MAAPRYGTHVPMLETFVWPLGTRSADAIEAIAFDAPWDGKLVHFEVTARDSGGTLPTCAVDIQQGTTSLLASVVAITKDVRTEATLAANPVFTKDTMISVDLDLGGTSPVFTDVTVIAVFERR